MDPRKFRLGLLFATAAIALSFVAPLAPGVPSLLAALRPLAGDGAGAACCSGLRPGLPDARGIAPGLAGVVICRDRIAASAP